MSKGAAKRPAPKGRPVSELVSEEALKHYGYLSLRIGVMQAAGSAAQTVAGIRSHWGNKTFADERTIAVAACIDESTVRRRHLPKLHRLKFLDHHMIESRLGHRREWCFMMDMKDAFWSKGSVTLPRWAALALPEWSYRAVYAVVLQRTLATARGTQKDEMKLDAEDVMSGNYGRHNFSLTDLCRDTGLTRRAVAASKSYLLQFGWLVMDTGYRRGGHGLYINGELRIQAEVLDKARKTTRKMMFTPKQKGAKNVAA